MTDIALWILVVIVGWGLLAVIQIVDKLTIIQTELRELHQIVGQLGSIWNELRALNDLPANKRDRESEHYSRNQP